MTANARCFPKQNVACFERAVSNVTVATIKNLKVRQMTQVGDQKLKLQNRSKIVDS